MLINISPYWTHPITGGGPARIAGFNKSLSNHIPVFQLSIRPTYPLFLKSLFRGTNLKKIKSDYFEIQINNPIISLTSAVIHKFNVIPDLFSRNLTGDLITRFIDRFSDNSLIQFEHPWFFKKSNNSETVIYNAHNFESELISDQNNRNNFLKAKITSKVKKMEYQAIFQSDVVIFTSEKDKIAIETAYGNLPNHSLILPNGIEIREFENSHDLKIAFRKKLGLPLDKFIFVFIGSIHKPNIEAVNRLIEISKHNPDSFFLVIGSVMKPMRAKNFMSTGFLSEISEHMFASDYALNPLFNGSGSSLKVLEYINYRLPIISTEFGMRGISLKPDTDFIHSNFKRNTNLNKTVLNYDSQKMTMTSFEYLKDHHDWKIIADKWLKYFRGSKFLKNSR